MGKFQITSLGPRQARSDLLVMSEVSNFPRFRFRVPRQVHFSHAGKLFMYEGFSGHNFEILRKGDDHENNTKH